jgi:hypothetical protein
MSTVQGGQGNIVTNGLILNLDAANPRSYPQPYNGTTWTDLSGNINDGTLINGPTYNSSNGGSIVFDGVDDFVNTSITTAFNNFTVCVWFKQVGSIIGYQRLIDKNFQNGFWVGRNASTANSWGGGIQDSSAPFGRFITLADTQWHYIVSKREGTIHTIYGDGITNTISGTVSSTALSSNNIFIGKSDQVGLDLMNGNISSVHLYNRALSASEVLQNFNATRARFGV